MFGLCFGYALLSGFSSFAIILTRKRELAAMLLLSCLVIVRVLWLFLTVPWAGMQCVIVVFPDHTTYQVCLNNDIRLTSTYFMPRSNMLPNAY